MQPGRPAALRRRRRPVARATSRSRAALGEFCLYDEYDPRRAILFDTPTDGAVVERTTTSGDDARPRCSTSSTSTATRARPVLGCVDVRAERHAACSRTYRSRRRRRRDLRRPRQRLDGRRHRPRRPLRRLGQRPAQRRRRDDRRPDSATERQDPAEPERHARHAPDLRGPRLRRRRPRRPDRQHRRRPADRLGRRVQQLHRAVRAVRHRHRQPPAAAAAARVPVRALGQRRRRPDPRRPTPARRPGPSRNGEPYGELGLVTQKDHGLAGPDRRPDRPAARQHPRRHSATCCARPTSTTARCRTLRRRQRRLGGAAAARCRSRPRRSARTRRRSSTSTTTCRSTSRSRPTINADEADRRLEGERLRHLRLLQSPTDFKFAGIDVAHQQARDGPPRRDRLARRDAQGAVPGSVKADTWYDMLVAVNGTTVTVSVERQQLRSPTRSRRGSSTASPYGLNKGFVGVGSDNARGSCDNFAVQVAAARADPRLDATSFTDGVPDRFTGGRDGLVGRQRRPLRGDGRRRVDRRSRPRRPRRRAASRRTPASRSPPRCGRTASAASCSTRYDADRFKFVALDVAGAAGADRPRRQRPVGRGRVGREGARREHRLHPRRSRSRARRSACRSTGRSRSASPSTARSSDGAVGVLSRGGTTSFDAVRVKTNDRRVPGRATRLGQRRVDQRRAARAAAGRRR